MIKMGMLIGGRYEVLEKIGTGGMSNVYKARDEKLNRLVAVKVLKHEFSENTNFVSKFRVEAQAAAGLMHPNIVNVYDVGDDDGIHYIVMELVEGITLKKYIEKKVRLSTKEAISIAIQVAMGIEAAHNNHIIHRDIKPQNIIISKEGKVKVTDFGIAKAASSNTITSNVMGSVHYTSPEQARGGFSDEKSDIYSMGVTLFEMLTGRVPFNGDTTVAIAIKHIQDPMPAPREFVPEIPVSVENIVLKCTQKSQDRRYQSMGDIIKDLKHSLINPDEVIAKVDIVDEAGKTKVVPTAQQQPVPMPAMLETVWENRVPRKELYAQEDVSEEVQPYAEQKYNYSNANNANWNNETEEVYGDDSNWDLRQSNGNKGNNKNANTKNGNKNNNKNKKNNSKNSVNKNNTNNNGANKKDKNVTYNNKKRTVSNNSGKTAPAHSDKNYESRNNSKYYEDNTYSNEPVNRKNVRDIEYDKGVDEYSGPEYDFNPRAEKITTILTVLAAIIIGCILLYFVGEASGIFSQSGISQGTQVSDEAEADRAVMPEFTGLNVEEVKASLNKEGLGCKTKYIETTKYAKNIVVSAALEDGQTVLANDRILKNTTIVLTVSAGSNGVEIPEVIGLSEAEGTATLTNEGFKVVKTDQYSTEYARGTIISQSPEGKSVAALESEVTIVISKGSENIEVRMPEVVGHTKEAGISNLEAAGLVVGKIEESFSEYPEGQICYQSYVAGTNVSQGTVVDLKVSMGSENAKYSCNLMIQAPADYIGGNAEVILTTADGQKQLWYSQNATSFPVSIKLSDFESPSAYGIVTISYLKNVEEIVVDSDGNKTTQVNQALAQTTQNVQFEKN